MARFPTRACSFPQCPNVIRTKSNYCKEHQKKVGQDYEKSYRKPRPKRYSTRQWQNIRKIVLTTNPFCVDPFSQHKRYGEGPRVLASEVDHIDGNPENNHEDNLQSLCKSCHSRKTAVENGRWGRKDEVYTAPYQEKKEARGEI